MIGIYLQLKSVLHPGLPDTAMDGRAKSKGKADRTHSETCYCFRNRLIAGMVKGAYTRVYINQGLGGLDIRLGDRTEITVLKLISK